MTLSDLHTLYAHPERPYSSILSIYLNVDQSQRSNRNRGFEKQLENMTSSIRKTVRDAAEMERFLTSAHHIHDFVSAYEPNVRGLVLFYDGLDGFFWHQELGISVHNQARWDHELFLQPLANILDQFERYGVVLIDPSRLRLFKVFLGEIEEIRIEGFGPDARVRYIGNAHLRRALKEVNSFVQDQQVHRLVLAGSAEMTAELLDALPKRLALLVIGTTNIPFDATAREVLSATSAIDEEYESGTEIQTVKEVLRGAARNEKTAAGLKHTLNAVNSGRVWELIYSEGLTSPGFECEKCAALFAIKRKACLYCGAPVHSVNDVVERAVDHVLRKGAKVEVVTGEAAASLGHVGGIAAFLKTKTASLQASSGA